MTSQTLPQTTTEHRPTDILSPDGTGIRTVVACSCGWEPKKGAASSTSRGTAYKAHCRKMGVQWVHLSESTYATGKGYPAEGMTWNQWYAEHKDDDADPFGVR